MDSFTTGPAEISFSTTTSAPMLTIAAAVDQLLAALVAGHSTLDTVLPRAEKAQDVVQDAGITGDLRDAISLAVALNARLETVATQLGKNIW